MSNTESASAQATAHGASVSIGASPEVATAHAAVRTHNWIGDELVHDDIVHLDRLLDTLRESEGNIATLIGRDTDTDQPLFFAALFTSNGGDAVAVITDLRDRTVFATLVPGGE